MRSFITGVLELNRYGLTQDADHFLALRHASGRLFQIMAPARLSETLQTGHTYEMVLRATIFASADEDPEDVLRFYPQPPSDSFDGWEGQVQATNWRASRDGFIAVRPALYQGTWLRVTTIYGDLLMRSKVARATGTPIEAGGILRWGESRLDLYGVVHPGGAR